MATLAAMFQRAVAAHRDAAAHVAAAHAAAGHETLGAGPAGESTMRDSAALRETVEALRQVADTALPGWLGASLGGSAIPSGYGHAVVELPVAVRIGAAQPVISVTFPAAVPLLGGCHLALDADARDPRIGAVLRSIVTRLLAAAPAGELRVLAADQAALGATFLPLRPFVEAGALSEPATADDAVGRLLDEAEAHVRDAQAHPAAGGWLLFVAASLPRQRAALTRLVALSHAGVGARVCVVCAGFPPRAYAGEAGVGLGNATQVRVGGTYAVLGDPPGEPFSVDGRGLAARVVLDGEPSTAVVRAVGAHLRDELRRGSAFTFADLVPAEHWTESSVDGLRTRVGRSARTPVDLSFDDATPHWLVAGRTGAGKTVFLLDVLYGLAARYSPAELMLYLLDFKEGISFTEFVPTRHDESWIPHARAVGIESDREYGVAVLRELRRELNRRANTLKGYGATKLSDLRRASGELAMPRIVTVVDEFHVLFAGNDALAREATGLLEELARKGRSYGIHLVLASQTVSGVEALYGKTESIFGQFPLRAALPGGGGILDPLNAAADGLTLGTVNINTSAGAAGADTRVRFPDAHADRPAVTALRQRLFAARPAGARAPSVFHGYATSHVEDDPTYRGLVPGGRRPLALVGRVVDVDLSTAYFPFDATPGRHLAIVGTSPTGADVLHAATVSLARQHVAGTVRFVVAPLVASADEVADETLSTLSGHDVSTVDAVGLRSALSTLAKPTSDGVRTYVVVFGFDAAGATLAVRDESSYRSGLDDLQTVLRQGPGYGVHVLGWWRGLRRLSDDIGGSSNRDDVACVVALNVPGQELGMYFGVTDLAYQPRGNRALLVDRHDQRNRLIVPFVRPGRVTEELA